MGGAVAEALAWRPAAEPPRCDEAMARWAPGLPASGLDGEVVREWLAGEAPGPVCLARLFDDVHHGRCASD
eukprot:6734400-Pyramimonas_sp.AAC.1